jgi:CBS domain-containing protein
MLSSVKAKDVMTGEVLVARAGWSLQHLSEFFVEYAISGAPVIGEKGNLLGVVSTTDLVRYRAIPVKNPLTVGPHRFYLEPHDDLSAEEEIEELRSNPADADATVKDIMTYAVFNVEDDAPLTTVIDAMVRGNIHRVFVTHDNQLVGIITAIGLLEYFSRSRCFEEVQDS